MRVAEHRRKGERKGERRLESPARARQEGPARRGGRGRSLSFDKWSSHGSSAAPRPSGPSDNGRGAPPHGSRGDGGGDGGGGGGRGGGGGGGRGGGRGSNPPPPLNARPPTQSFEEQLRHGPLMSGGLQPALQPDLQPSLQPCARREPRLQRATSFGSRMPARSLPQSETLGRHEERRTSLDAASTSPAGLDFAGGVDLRRASGLMDFSPRRR